MNTELTKNELGRRIASLRKRKGFSQSDLAKELNISRPSLAQTELGNRSLDAIELLNLSIILGFSLDEFMVSGNSVSEPVAYYIPRETAVSEERIAVPELDFDKFRNVLLYLLERCAGKPNIGETALFKLLYFSDFNYYELYEEHLTGSAYRKLPYGPVPQKIDAIISQMMEAGQVQRVKTHYFGLPQTRYLPLTKANLTQLKASEKDVLDQVIAQMSDWSAATISRYAHQDMPWLATKDGAVMQYELAFYREAPFSVRNYGEESEQS